MRAQDGNRDLRRKLLERQRFQARKAISRLRTPRLLARRRDALRHVAENGRNAAAPIPNMAVRPAPPSSRKSTNSIGPSPPEPRSSRETKLRRQNHPAEYKLFFRLLRAAPIFGRWIGYRRVRLLWRCFLHQRRPADESKSSVGICLGRNHRRDDHEKGYRPSERKRAGSFIHRGTSFQSSTQCSAKLDNLELSHARFCIHRLLNNAFDGEIAF